MPSGPATFVEIVPVSRARKPILRAGFAVVIGCLGFSAFYAYRLQSTLSEQTRDIYHRHLNQDNVLYMLRRTIWLGSAASRDYLVDPSPGAALRLSGEAAKLRGESLQLVDELARNAVEGAAASGVEEGVTDFWTLIASTPTATQGMTARQRYEFAQAEIVPRRNAARALVREFAEVSENWLKESEAEFARTRRAVARRLLLILGLSIAFSILTAVLSLAHAESLERKTVEQYREVERARAELQELSARLLEIQEQERTRLSRELHDEIGQMIATLRLEVARSESLPADRFAEVRERLGRARELAEKTLQSIRNICLMLRPGLLDDLGLEPALEWQVEDFTRRTGIACKLSAEGLSDDLPDPVRTCVYRVLQESLHNCEKHSGASQVRVSISQAGGSLAMEIEDNGLGFDPAAATETPRARFGILGMRERAAGLKGSFEIRSSAGAGTTIRLGLPLASPAGVAKAGA